MYVFFLEFRVQKILFKHRENSYLMPLFIVKSQIAVSEILRLFTQVRRTHPSSVSIFQ